MSTPRDQNLSDLQRWMLDAITHPDGPRSGAGAGASSLKGEKPHAVIRRSKNLTSFERINIYHEMYYLRLIEILEGDFSSVRHAAGEERFTALARNFIVEHPSRHYDLGNLGAKFPMFLRRVKNLKHRSFIADLGKLERAIEEVFDETQVAALKTDELLSVPQGRWAEARLRTIPAFRLIASRYPINTYLEAVRKDRDPQIPAAEPTWVCIYRKKFTVWRMDLGHPQFNILTALSRGKTVGEAIETCLELPETATLDLAASIQTWFKDWAASGFFSAVILA